MKKKIIEFGGDGYLGWPVSIFLSKLNYKVLSIDNYDKRKISKKLGIKPIFPISSLEFRIKIWNKICKKNKVDFKILNICNYKKIVEIFKNFKPDCIIHFAEQPSAPYSMKGYSEASYTLQNNLITTFNIVQASKETGIFPHIIKLGTMGEYGTPNIDIEEGFIDITHKNREDRFLFPRQGGSLYHTTKILDTDLLYFYVRAWGLRVTDLMQGPVYGLFTNETELDERLNTCFYYDSVFGTIINRFVVQALNGVPLTVYGKGNQKRGYINIKDTLKCIHIAISNPPNNGQMKILNQFTEVFSVNELAKMVTEAGKICGLKDITIKKIKNPRIELEEHYYNPVHNEFKKLGLNSEKLKIETLVKLIKYLSKFKNNIDKNQILPNINWV
ncbi:NAD-dependent epimerase/dehydratase family protein [Rickettsiales bacterium]|nr:NAD-dependent epimerase/dehydratase family protein [Rickettsiales bacterium]